MRALKTLVIVMGILVLAGMALVGFVLVKRATAPEPQSKPPAIALPPAPPPVLRPFGPVELALPPGAHILRTTTSGEHLLVELELATGGERLLVVDLASGALVGTIDLKPQP